MSDMKKRIKKIIIVSLFVRYSWTKDGKFFDWKSNNRIKEYHDGSLYILTPKEEDAGMLQLQ